MRLKRRTVFNPSEYGNLINALENPDYNFLICQEFLDEILDVISRPKFRRWFTADAGRSLVDFIVEHSQFYTIENNPVAILRDPKDSYLINLAEQYNADYLVTNDNDLLSLKGKLDKTNVISLAEFMEIYSKDMSNKESMISTNHEGNPDVYVLDNYFDGFFRNPSINTHDDRL